MSDITVSGKVLNDWLDVIADNIDLTPATTWTTSPSRTAVGGTILPTDSGANPYVFASSSTSTSVTSITVNSGVATMVSTGHDLQAGEKIVLSGAVPSQLNNTQWTITTVTDANIVEFNVLDISDGAATGTITYTRDIAYKGASEPVWPVGLGSTVTSGKITWTNLGPIRGKVRIYSGNRPANGVLITNQVLLAELLFSVPSAPSALGGVLTFSSITSDSSANATGVATWARILNCSDTTVFDCKVSGLDGSGDIKLSSVNITSGGTVSISSMTISFSS